MRRPEPDNRRWPREPSGRHYRRRAGSAAPDRMLRALCGDSVSGALALALAADGLRWAGALCADADRAAGSGFAGAAAPAGSIAAVLGGIALHGERLDLAPLLVRHRVARRPRLQAKDLIGLQCRAGGETRNRRRALFWSSGGNHARRAGPGIDVNRRFLGRYQLFTDIARRHAVRDLGGATISLGRHHLGRAVAAVMTGGSPLRGEPT